MGTFLFSLCIHSAIEIGDPQKGGIRRCWPLEILTPIWTLSAILKPLVVMLKIITFRGICMGLECIISSIFKYAVERLRQMLIVIPGIPLDVYSCKNNIFARKTFIILRLIISKHYNRRLIKDS